MKCMHRDYNSLTSGIFRSIWLNDDIATQVIKLKLHLYGILTYIHMCIVNDVTMHKNNFQYWLTTH